MIIDAHQHVWDPARAEYSWFGREHAAIARPIGMDEVLPSFRRGGIVGSVLVQSADNAEDTRNMLEVAARHPSVLGVVGWVPLDRPDDAAEGIAQRDPLIVGVRNLIHDRADPDWLLRPDVDEGLGVLERAGIPFDLVGILPRHLELVPTLSERHPELVIVLDHLAHPPVGADLASWASLLRAAAANPRVHAKVSGLYPPSPLPPSATAGLLRPILDRALDLLGSSRLMYGGDWPISILSSGYDATWSGVATLFDELPASDRAEVLAGTAARVYGLAPDRLRAASELAASELAGSELDPSELAASERDT